MNHRQETDADLHVM